MRNRGREGKCGHLYSVVFFTDVITQTLTVLSSTETVTSSSPIVTSQSLTRYADYLRAVYKRKPLASKLSHFCGKVFIKLALIKKQKVSRGNADDFIHFTLQGHIDTILKIMEPIAMEDILKDIDTNLVVVEGAPGIGKSTLAWEVC